MPNFEGIKGLAVFDLEIPEDAVFPQWFYCRQGTHCSKDGQYDFFLSSYIILANVSCLFVYQAWFSLSTLMSRRISRNSLPGLRD